MQTFKQHCSMAVNAFVDITKAIRVKPPKEFHNAREEQSKFWRLEKALYMGSRIHPTCDRSTR
eukprot:6482806-Amphidinium_carterae.1